MEYTTPRRNPKVHYGLWVIMMCQCRFINDNKMYSSGGDVDNGGVYAYVGMGVYRKSLYLPLNFAMDLKLL